MSKSILQMVNAAQGQLGLPLSTSAFSTTDATGYQMGALANQLLDELRRMNGWSALQFEYDLVVNVASATAGNMAAGTAVITGIPTTAALTANYWQVAGAGIPTAARVISVDSATQVTMSMVNTNTSALVGTALTFSQDTYPEPSGFDYFNNRTMWDRTNHWELQGPDSAQVDQWHRSGIVATGPRRSFRQLGPYANNFRIWPSPAEIATPLQLVFEYISLNAVKVAGSATSFAQYFVNDTDTCLLDENAIIMGIKWMFWEIKGFGSYVTMQNRWIDYVSRLIARDGGAATLTLARQPTGYLVSSSQVQDGFWPGPTGPNAS